MLTGDRPAAAGGAAPPTPSPAHELYLTIGAPIDPATAPPFQDALDDWTYLFDVRDPASPVYECQHDEAGTLQKMAERRTPHEIPCMAAPGDIPLASGGKLGGNVPPQDMTGWAGVAEGGGCGSWAAATCNRRLGLTPADADVTMEEFNAIAQELGQSSSGGADEVGLSRYYEARGYCAAYRQWFQPTDADWSSMAEKLADGCDVKLYWAKYEHPDRYVNGHIETVLAVEGNSAVTNSWGHEGLVVGGAYNFHHSREQSFRSDPGTPAWPPRDTDVYVLEVCPCGFFESLGKLVLGN